MSRPYVTPGVARLPADRLALHRRALECVEARLRLVERRRSEHHGERLRVAGRIDPVHVLREAPLRRGQRVLREPQP